MWWGTITGQILKIWWRILGDSLKVYIVDFDGDNIDEKRLDAADASSRLVELWSNERKVCSYSLFMLLDC